MPRAARSRDADLDRIVRALAESVRPLRVVLFGSRARGDATAASDYDLLIEVEEERRGDVERLVSSLRHARRWRADVIVMSPEEYAARSGDVGLLAYQIRRDGRLLFARDGSAIGQQLRTTRLSERRRGRPPSVALWVRKAENDLLMIGRALDAGAPIPDVAAFHAHQSAEKYLKAVIVASHRPPPRTHDLGELLEHCPPRLGDDDALRVACEELSKLYVRSRYPLGQEPTEEEARHAAALAGTIRDAARAVLGS